MNSTWRKRKKRIFEIIEVGNDLDYVSRLYDYVNALAIIINLAATILYTYEEITHRYFGRAATAAFAQNQRMR